jgi:hypothetical protein
MDTHESELSIEVEPDEILEMIPSAEKDASPVSELHNTLGSIQKILQSPQFTFSSPGERFEELNSLITQAKEQSEAKPELNQLIKEFAEKLSSTESTLSEICATFEEAQTKL